MQAFLNYFNTFVSMAILGVIGWALNLNSEFKELDGRVNLLDQKHVDLKELINSRFDSTDQRLARIERAMNGSLRHD